MAKIYALQPAVAAKYIAHPSFLDGRKLLFPHTNKHHVANKPAHELTVEEVDKLMEHKALEGVFSLKPVEANLTAPVISIPPVAVPVKQAARKAKINQPNVKQAAPAEKDPDDIETGDNS